MKINFTFFLLLGIPVLSQAQNTCGMALPVTAGTTYAVTTVDGMTTILACASGGNTQSATEWYTYTPTANYSVTVTTDLPASGGTDTRLHVYTGACGSLTCYAGDDDSGSGLTSTAIFNVTSGTTYIIAFDNIWTSDGFSFKLTEAPIVVQPTPPVTFTANSFPSVTGNYGLATTDMDGDFLDDIVTVSSSSVQILYQQISGAYITTSIPTPTANFEPSWSMAIGDIDKNGFNDMLYGGGNGVTFMKANSTGTGFTQVAGTEYVFCQRTNFVDINNDGHLDAFSCHDVQPNVYYLNDGTGNLTFHAGGLGDHTEGGNYGSIWMDYDNDGDQDLFIAKCRGGASTAKIDELHRNDSNNGNVVFTNVSVAAGMASPSQSWSSAWNDFDNDGFMDALIGISSPADGGHLLMKNDGDGTFSNVTAGSGWDVNPSTSIEHVSFDFDNDGFTDIMGGDNKILFGNGDMTFYPIVYAFSSGAVGDMNNDGFLDVRNGSTVFMNNKNSNNWIKINLQGIQSNSNGIGARVEIYGSWGKQIRDIRSGDGFKYMNTLNAHFGIGTATGIDSIMIKWPSGHIDQVNNPTINQAITVVEGAHPLSLLEVNGKKIALYPNPTTDYLTIENFDLLDASSIQIYTQTGERVMNTEKKDSKITLNGLASGRYFLVIQTKDGEKYSESFIKM